jgi:hypothetical protein
MTARCIKTYLSPRLANFVDSQAKRKQLSLSGWIVRLIEREAERQTYDAEALQRQYDAVRAGKNGITRESIIEAIAYLRNSPPNENDSY